MIAPPTDAAAANCHPISTTSTMPNSTTKLVEANINALSARLRAISVPQVG